MPYARAIFLLLLPAAVAGAAADLPLDLLPPGTRILLGCSVESLKNSPLLKGAGVSSGNLPGTLGTAASQVGFDPLKDVDSIIFAAAGSKEDSPAVAILRGRFPMSPKKVTMYRGVPLLEDPRNPKYSLAVLDGATAIAGTAAQVRAALDRRGRAPGAVPKIAARFLELGASSDLWGVGDVPDGLGAGGSAGSNLQAIDRFEFGAALHDGLRFRAQVHARTTQQASKVLASLQVIATMLKAQAPGEGATFDLRVENGGLEIELFVPEAELRKAMAAQKEQFAAMLQKGIAMSRTGGTPAGFARPTFPGLTVQPGAPAPLAVRSVPGSPASVVTSPQGETVNVMLPGPK